MKTFLKVLLLFAVVAVVIYLCPVAAVPLALGGAVALVIGCVLVGGVAFVATIALVLAVVIGLALLAIAAASSPIWLPLLAIIGLVALLRRGGDPRRA